MQRYRVVIPREDGGVEVHPLKEWLRQNPDHIPNGLDPTTSTSHQLRNALRRAGWQVQMTPSEVRLIKSSMSDSGSVVETVLGEALGADIGTNLIPTHHGCLHTRPHSSREGALSTRSTRAGEAAGRDVAKGRIQERT